MAVAFRPDVLTINSTLMATLDRFIEVMFDKQASSLVLESDKPMALDTPAGRKAVTKEAVDTAKIVALLKEITPPRSTPRPR